MKIILIWVACLLSMAVGIANLIVFYFWWPEMGIYGAKEIPFEALEAARSLGRLDLVSFWLTVLGIFLAVMALIGFNFIRSEAKSVAENTARRVANQAVIRSLEDRKGIEESSQRRAALLETKSRQRLDSKTKEESSDDIH
ncbi:MAG: hypothetical protein OXE84_14525 [Rhodobacteraceae bacterium]|nr:hypothetical protein [Paracoccaceae bacterium]